MLLKISQIRYIPVKKKGMTFFSSFYSTPDSRQSFLEILTSSTTLNSNCSSSTLKFLILQSKIDSFNLRVPLLLDVFQSSYYRQWYSTLVILNFDVLLAILLKVGVILHLLDAVANSFPQDSSCQELVGITNIFLLL